MSMSMQTVIVLRRIPRFVQWSSTAQPDGYPDAIDITFRPGSFGSQTRPNVDAVLRGQFDWTPDFLNGVPGLVNDLARTHTTQLHPFASNGTHFYFLNTTVAPFNDVRVRQAVNYAIDRRAVAESFSGRLVA